MNATMTVPEMFEMAIAQGNVIDWTRCATTISNQVAGFVAGIADPLVATNCRRVVSGLYATGNFDDVVWAIEDGNIAEAMAMIVDADAVMKGFDQK